MNRSLRARLVFSFSILVLMVFFLFALFLYLGIERIVIQRVDETLFDKARYLSTLVKVEEGRISFTLSKIDIGEFIGPAAKSYFILRLDTGEILYKSPSLGNKEFPLNQIPGVGKVSYFTIYENGSKKRVVNYHFAKEDELFKDLSFFLPVKKYGFLLQVGRDLRLESDIIKRFIFYLITLAILALLFMALLISKMVELSLSSIKKISYKVKLISEKNLSERVDPERVDVELKELAIAINDTFDRLKMAFERQKEFISYVSHELRTPISGIKLITEISLRKKRSQEDYIRYLRDIEKSVNHLSRLVNSILLLSRMDMGREHLKMEELSLLDIIRDALHIISPIAEEKNIKIEYNIENVRFIGDKDAFLEIFVNILDNAIKYNKEKGWVKISNKGFEVVIEDSGIGIPEKDLPHVFERFYRAEASRSRKTGGTGLGLSIAYELIKRQHGDIKIESRVGEGTKVIIILPQ